MKLTATQALELGVAAHKEGKLHEAELTYRAILASLPPRPATNPDLNVFIAQVYSNLGVALQHRGNLEAAIDSYKKAVENKPDYTEVYYNMGQAFRDKGDLKASIECYYQAVKNTPDDAGALNNLGAALQHSGELEAAIDSYTQALKIKSDYTEAYYNMGQALRDKGDLKASIACYQRAVEVKPDDADAFNNLAAALQHNGELEAAIECYKQAVKISPECAEAYNNMGSALHARGDLDAAIDSYNQALKIKPDYANAYNNLGHALHDKGDLEASIDCYKSALKIMPGSTETHNNMGNALREIGEYQEAVKHFDLVTTSEENPSKTLFWLNSKSQSLECLYILGRYSELEERLNLLAESGDINLRVAGVSAFVTQQLKLKDPYPFCKTPLDFVQVGNFTDYVSDVNSFAEDLILEATEIPQVWEPRHGVTKFGFQTSPTVFRAGKNCEALEKILRQQIDLYYSKFNSEDCAFINSWPAKYDLRGWFVRLLKNGHQRSHNHPSGWLSGIVYLKTIDSLDTDDGSIAFSLHGHDLPILDESYPSKIHRPKRGDIVLFPSSLYHRTIPFSKDTDRCVIAFDLNRY